MNINKLRFAKRALNTNNFQTKEKNIKYAEKCAKWERD